MHHYVCESKGKGSEASYRPLPPLPVPRELACEVRGPQVQTHPVPPRPWFLLHTPRGVTWSPLHVLKSSKQVAGIGPWGGKGTDLRCLILALALMPHDSLGL